MQRLQKHLLRYRKNQGTSCLLVVLLLILIALIAFYWWLHHRDNVPVKHAKPDANAPDTLQNGKQPAPEPAKEIKPTAGDAFAQRMPRMLNKGDYLLVEKSAFTLKHYRDGALLASYPVAVGEKPEDKATKVDKATPEGHFEINFIKDSSTWSYDFGDGKGVIKGAYGPWYLALYTGNKRTFSGNTWTGIAIHGTHDPASIGTKASEGCVRLHNEDLIKLKTGIEGKKTVQVDIVK